MSATDAVRIDRPDFSWGRTVIRLAIVASLASLAGCSALRDSQPPVIGGSTAISARAAAPDTPKQPDPAEVKALEKTLRDLLRKNLPDPIVQSSRGWGHQKEGLVGVHLRQDGPRLLSEREKAMRNDGAWRRVSIRAANPERTLDLGIVDAAFPEPGRATFTAMLGVDCDLKFERQLWRNGVRLYGGETRGRCRVAVLLKCEANSRTETKPGSFVPDVVFRVKVTEAQLFYDKLVIEHTAGVGGDAAKILGEAVLDAVKQAKPDLERDLLTEANAAIVKAADTKYVRLSLDSFLKGGPTLTQSK